MQSRDVSKDLELLDQLAGQALPAIIERMAVEPGSFLQKPEIAERIAKSTYAIAKAVLEERKNVHAALYRTG